VIFRRRPSDPDWPKQDAGSGSLDDYKFDLAPANGRVTIRLAGSDPHQDVLATAAEAARIETAIVPRTMEEERTDARMPVRLFADGRVYGPVGVVPRGLEGVVSETLSRLERSGTKARIPVSIAATKQGLRVDLLIGATR
jgi:hypothetical protein